jgi:hypothetical protein
MRCKGNNPPILIIGPILVLLLITYSLYYIAKVSADCEKRGGLLVKTFAGGSKCIKVEVVK